MICYNPNKNRQNITLDARTTVPEQPLQVSAQLRRSCKASISPNSPIISPTHQRSAWGIFTSS